MKSLISAPSGCGRWLPIAAVAACGALGLAGCAAGPHLATSSGGSPRTSEGQLRAETLVVNEGPESITIAAGAALTNSEGVQVSPGSVVAARTPGIVTISRASGLASARHLTVSLSTSVIWNILIVGGTTEEVLDLTAIHLSGLEVEGGAESMLVDLPIPRGKVSVAVSGGANTIAFHVPQGTAIQVKVTAGIARFLMPGLTATSDGHSQVFTLGDYSTAADSYSLRLTAGASRLVIAES